MKKIGLSLAMITFLIIASCDKKVEKTVESTETTTVLQDTVVKEVPAEDDGTSVKVDSNGVDIDSKDVKVEVK
jgi:hypothetical protein